MNIFSRIGGAIKYAATGKVSASAFEGAMQSRRLVSWKATQENINTLLSAGGDTLRARARQIVRSNPYAANAADSFVANAVGAGIKPSSLIADAVLKKAIQEAWLAWTDEADADGLTDFYGLQALVARAMFEAGECFVRFRPRRTEDGLTVPLQIQLLEAEMLPFNKTETYNGNELRCGIEFDKIGRRVAVPTKYVIRRENKKITPADFEEAGIPLRYVPPQGARKVGLLVVDDFRITSKGKARAASDRMRKTGKSLATVVMFILIPQATIKKRFDIDSVAQKWLDRLPQLVLGHWPDEKETS